MTLADRLGLVRFYQIQGQPYTQIVREAIKPALGMSAVSKFLGTSAELAIWLGITTAMSLMAFDIVMGWIATRYDIYQAQVRAEWKANPFQARQMQLLESIADNTQRMEST